MTKQTERIIELRDRDRAESRAEAIADVLKLYENNVKIPIRDDLCQCCKLWVIEANNFKQKLKELTAK